MEKKKKPRLSFWQIWNMSFGFLGIQFGFALQNANVSRIFETLGANIENIPILWIAAPVTGLIVQPIIGHMSDNTWNRLGRRRPYFLVGAILASIALIIMPNSPVLWVAAGMLWIMDASINISMEPFRAFVGDMLPSEQRTKGFAMQSFFIGLGAVIASALPYVMTNWFGISNTAPEGEIPDSVKFSFYVGAAAFLLAVLWTVIRTKEYSPGDLERFSEDKPSEKDDRREKLEQDMEMNRKLGNGKVKGGLLLSIGGIVLTFLVYYFSLAKETYVLSIGLAAFGILQTIAGAFQQKGNVKNGLVTVFNDFAFMPKTMVQLAFVQFFSWFALFAMWIYTTAGVTSHIYDMKMNQHVVNELTKSVQGMDPAAGDEAYVNYEDVKKELEKYQQRLSEKEEVTASMKVVKFFLDEKKEDIQINGDVEEQLRYIQKEYNKGADWVGVAFAVYNGFAALVAFLLPVVARRTNRRITHLISLLLGALGLISLYFINNPDIILVAMLGVGVAWASILSMPYAMLAGALPSSKMGVYMGIFNFFLVLPQILAATVLGGYVSLFDGQAIYALILGGVSWIIAGIWVMFVNDVDEAKEAV
ncbi:MAG: MFS transporter [Bacteroidales bacterium]|nr:MFS transporter [Bacteroidales bacterium]